MEAPAEPAPRANRLRVARGRRSAAAGHDRSWYRAAGAECAIPGRPALDIVEDIARGRHLADVTRARPYPRVDIIAHVLPVRRSRCALVPALRTHLPIPNIPIQNAESIP